MTKPQHDPTARLDRGEPAEGAPTAEKDSRPTVSVCIPVFNAEGVVGRCLEAILRQTLDGSELLVIDNQSTDRTLTVVEQVLRGVPSARVIANEKNVGRVENWNRCLKEARGSWVKFMMANDVLWRGSLAILLAEALGHPGNVIVSSRHQFWDGRPADIPDARKPERVERYSGTAAIECVHGGGNPFWALNGALIAREPALANGIWFDTDLSYFADLDFCARLSTLGTTVHLPMVSYWFNTGVRSRVHFSGLVPEPYFREVRQVQRKIETTLLAAGRPIPPAEKGRLKVLSACLDQRTMPIAPLRAARLFENRRYQFLAGLLAGAHVLRVPIALHRVRSVGRRYLPWLVPVVRRVKAWARSDRSGV